MPNRPVTVVATKMIHYPIAFLEHDVPINRGECEGEVVVQRLCSED